MNLTFDVNGNKTTQNEELNSDEEYIYSSSDEEEDTLGNEEESECKKQEEIPEYRKITNDNMYEFIIWANDKRGKTIPVDHFNMILHTNIYNWIQQNNITWQYGLTVITDIINNQNDVVINYFGFSNNSAEGGDDVAAEGGDDVAAEGGDDGDSVWIYGGRKGGDDVVVEGGRKGGDDVVVEGGDDVAAEGGDEIIKPNSVEERRKLFAAAAEKRAAKKF